MIKFLLNQILEFQKKINSALETLLTCAGGQATQLTIYSFARWHFQRNFVWKRCNFVILGLDVMIEKVIARKMKPTPIQKSSVGWLQLTVCNLNQKCRTLQSLLSSALDFSKNLGHVYTTEQQRAFDEVARPHVTPHDNVKIRVLRPTLQY